MQKLLKLPLKGIDTTQYIVTEEVKRGAWSGELSANIAEDLFDSLKGPVKRIGSINTPIPFSTPLEKYVVPNEVDIIKGVKSIL